MKYLCIGSMLELNVFVTCFMMLSLCFNYYIHVSIIEILCLARGVKRQRSLGGNPTCIFLLFGFLVVFNKIPNYASIQMLVTESSSEEDSETDEQSYFPPGVYAQTWQGYITHVLHCIVFTSYMDCHLLTCLLYKSYI